MTLTPIPHYTTVHVAIVVAVFVRACRLLTIYTETACHDDWKNPALLSLYEGRLMLLDWLGPNAPWAPEGPTSPVPESLAYTTFLPAADFEAGSDTAYIGWSSDGSLSLL